MRFQFKACVLVVILVSIFTTSCKKDHNDLPATLYLKNITFKDEVRIYTKNGEITDPLVRDRSKISTGINLISHPINPQANSAHVTFLSNNSFLLTSERYSYEKLNDTFIFTYVDSLLVHPNGNDVLTVIPFYKNSTVRNNNDGTFTYWKQFVGHGGYSALQISGMDLCVLKRDTVTGAITQRRFGVDLNEFNADAIKSLGKYDTLAVREYSYNYALDK
jgi:hypothetical protein